MMMLWFLQAKAWLVNLVGRREEGQTLVEYAMLIMLIALVVIGVVTVLGETLRDVYYQVIVDEFP
jgi:Flp pilus assembly pilin Flp